MKSSRQNISTLPCSAGRTSGFSLLELLMIMVIVGVLAAVAGPRMFSLTGFQARGFHDELISAVRYAQKLAVASGCEIKVTIAENRYELLQGDPGCDDPPTRLVQHPSTRNAFAGVAPADVTVSDTSLVFTALGSVAGGVRVTITVSGGGGTRTVLVHGDTGFVEVQP